MVQEANAYLEMMHQAMTQEKLVSQVFRQLIALLRQAQGAIDQGNIPTAHENLILAQEGIIYLSASLNKSAGELADNLESLYAYIHGLLVKANLLKDKESVEEAIKLLAILLEGWAQIPTATPLNPESSSAAR